MKIKLIAFFPVSLFRFPSSVFNPCRGLIKCRAKCVLLRKDGFIALESKGYRTAGILNEQPQKCSTLLLRVYNQIAIELVAPVNFIIHIVL